MIRFSRLMGANVDLEAQTRALQRILLSNEHIQLILENGHRINFPNWYLGAGCIAQTVWNVLASRAPSQGIKDLDLVYFDASDLSEAGEKARQEEVRDLLGGIPLEVDIKNQARVHLWYEAFFGYSIRPYTDVEDAINSWPTTATAIGIRPKGRGLSIYAPFGLNDLFNRIVRPNKIQITEAIYQRKVSRWIAQWPELTVIPWSQ